MSILINFAFFLMGTIMTLNIVLILICRMEFHMGELKKICRVCGRKSQKGEREVL